MGETHDPLRHVRAIRELLSQDKRPLGFVLSAGCPQSMKDSSGAPIIPDVAGMTSTIVKALAGQASLGTIIQGLRELGDKDPNIEAILTHIRALRAVIGSEEYRGLKAAALAELENRICEKIVQLTSVDPPSGKNPYEQIARWIGSVPRSHPVEIFTTNYDLLIENALDASRIPYFDGFVGGNRCFFDVNAVESDLLPPRWARLWKIHGSINWGQDANGVFRSNSLGAATPRVIHPSHMKYDESRRMPYLALMDRLKGFLRQPSAALLTCGYSYRDEHINEIIAQGLQGNQNAVVLAMTFGPLQRYAAARTLADRHSNFVLLSRDGAVVGGKQGVWGTREAPTPEAAEPLAIDWKDAGGAKKTAEFCLGDFARLGALIEDLAGSRSEGRP